MSINLRLFKAHRLTDFSGGLNEFDSSFTMGDNELQEATNVELRTGGAVRTRLGAPIYQRQAFSSIVAPVKNLFRYTRFNGEKKVIAYSGGTVYADDDNGEFASIETITSQDGYCRFAQWRQALLFGTELSDLYMYDPAHPAADPSIVVNTSGIYGAWLGISDVSTQFTYTSVVAANGALEDLPAYYGYRTTLDVYVGDTFIGETGPGFFISQSAIGQRRLWQENAVGSGTGAGENAIEIRCGAGAALLSSQNGFRVGAVNFYRSLLPLSTPTYIPREIPETNMIWIGSIPDSAFSDTTTVQLLDLGLFAGRSIAPYYGRNSPTPRGRFKAIHKSRLWLGHVNYPVIIGNAKEFSYIYAPHRLYFSEINEVGAFLETSWVEIDPINGDGISGIASYKNKALIVFQPNAMWVIAGGDDEVGPGIPDISIENISTDIGCVAPESIQVCEGRVVWLSHRGVYYYDGTIPKPLKTENIDETLLVRPGTKYDEASSTFLVKDREYWLSHSDDGSYNNLLSKFSFKNSSWVRGDIGVGVASMVEKKSMDKSPIVLAGVEASSGTMSADTAVRYLEQGGYDGASSPISWAWKTKFLDFRAPMVDKKYVAVLVQLTSTTDVTMQVYCDNHLDGEPFIIKSTENDQDIDSDDLIWANVAGTSGGTWDDDEWVGDWTRNALIYLNTKCWGKRIALRFSGTSTAEPTEIQAVTIFYDPKEGVRQ